MISSRAARRIYRELAIEAHCWWDGWWAFLTLLAFTTGLLTGWLIWG